MNEIYELFEEFDTDTICVSDFDIQFRGARVDYILCDYDRNIEIWGGNPFTDKHAEQFLPTKEEKKFILESVLENY